MKIKRRNRLSVLFLFFCNFLFAQQPLISDFVIQDKDTFFVADIAEVEVLSFKDNQELKKYLLLKRRVLKVYPYALIAKEKLIEIEKGLDTIPKKRKKKKHTKAVAKFVKEEYSKKLKKLTMSEGRILVKLIYRETNITTYDIVKIHRGRFNAFFWQSMAKLWDNNLKTTYDPKNVKEDAFIEHIIIQAKSEGRFNLAQ